MHVYTCPVGPSVYAWGPEGCDSSTEELQRDFAASTPPHQRNAAVLEEVREGGEGAPQTCWERSSWATQTGWGDAGGINIYALEMIFHWDSLPKNIALTVLPMCPIRLSVSRGSLTSWSPRQSCMLTSWGASRTLGETAHRRRSCASLRTTPPNGRSTSVEGLWSMSARRTMVRSYSDPDLTIVQKIFTIDLIKMRITIICILESNFMLSFCR